MAKSNVRSYTDKELLDRVKATKGFQKIPEGYWILGVRSNEDEENTYDDKFYIFKGEVFQEVITGTTHPGAAILKGGFLRFNKVGAAVLKSDMWYGGIFIEPQEDMSFARLTKLQFIEMEIRMESLKRLELLSTDYLESISIRIHSSGIII